MKSPCANDVRDMPGQEPLLTRIFRCGRAKPASAGGHALSRRPTGGGLDTDLGLGNGWRRCTLVFWCRKGRHFQGMRSCTAAIAGATVPRQSVRPDRRKFPMVLQARKNGAPAAPTLEWPGAELPFCATCRTDEYLVFEEYVPSRIVPGDGPKPAETSYSCLMCGQFNAHEVPPGWEPPGWFWYA